MDYALRSVNDRAPNWANSSKITSRRDGVLMCPLEDYIFFILVGTLGTLFSWMHSAPIEGTSYIIIILFSRNGFSNHGKYPTQNYPKLSCLLQAENFHLDLEVFFESNVPAKPAILWKQHDVMTLLLSRSIGPAVTIWDGCKTLLNA